MYRRLIIFQLCLNLSCDKHEDFSKEKDVERFPIYSSLDQNLYQDMIDNQPYIIFQTCPSETMKDRTCGNNTPLQCKKMKADLYFSELEKQGVSAANIKYFADKLASPTDHLTFDYGDDTLLPPDWTTMITPFTTVNEQSSCGQQPFGFEVRCKGKNIKDPENSKFRGRADVVGTLSQCRVEDLTPAFICDHAKVTVDLYEGFGHDRVSQRFERETDAEAAIGDREFFSFYAFKDGTREFTIKDFSQGNILNPGRYFSRANPGDNYALVCSLKQTLNSQQKVQGLSGNRYQPSK